MNCNQVIGEAEVPGEQPGWGKGFLLTHNYQVVIALPPLIIGHRGYPRKYPENTVASFLGALLHGAAGVELDVRLSGDGEVVVIHDPDTCRVSRKCIKVGEVRLEVLRSLSLGMGQVVPLLSDVLKALPEGVPVFVEIKEVEAAVPAYEVVKSMNRLGDVIFISFYPEALGKIRGVDESARLGFLIGSLEAAKQVPKLATELRLYAVLPPIQGMEVLGREEFINELRALKAAGAFVAVWTVNDPEKARSISPYVDAVITDDPPTIFRAVSGG